MIRLEGFTIDISSDDRVMISGSGLLVVETAPGDDLAMRLHAVLTEVALRIRESAVLEVPLSNS